MKLVTGAVSDMGLVRSHNEDAFLVWDLAHESALEEERAFELGGEDDAFLLVVCDGMGGARSGEVASGTAVESMRSYATDAFHAARLGLGEREPRRWLADAVARSNEDVLTQSKEDLELHGMGATLTAATLLGDELVLAHVGDSRAYLLRGGRLRQLTTDHTHVQKLVSVGRISNEEARNHQQRNLLLQAIGTTDSVEVDNLDVKILAGDRILLCSDGLHGLVEDGEIAAVLGRDTEPIAQCRTLVESAKRSGGHDNITVIIAHLR